MLLFLSTSLSWAVPGTTNMIEIVGTKDIPDFWIDQFEFPNQSGVSPVSGLSLTSAQALCAKNGKRLCSAAEWRHACRGIGHRRFPYGEHHQRGVCHQSVGIVSSHTALMAVDVVPSGTYLECRTPEGVYDMVGNLEEWVLDDWRGQTGMLEGGASYTHDQYADCSGRYSRMADYRLSSEQEIFSAGVRCCWSEEPLSNELILLDKHARLTQSESTIEYNPTPEIRLPSGGWMDQYEYPNQVGVFPLTGITWFEATERCVQAGKRLCGVYEWEQACIGSDGRSFSAGHNYIKGSCSIERTSPSVSGEHKGCVNTYGLYDMSGSVWEWTGTDFKAPILESGFPEEMRPMAEIRGGSWMVEPSKATCRPDNGYPVTSKAMGYEDVGFRCCRGKEWLPSSLLWGSLIECPDDMEAIGGFCIDKFEHPNRSDEIPTQNLTWEQAVAVCEVADKRVCTEAEWTLACEGPDLRGYPYGAAYQSQRCATKDQHGVEIHKSGSHLGCVTPEGVYDMVGNVWEWTEAQNGLEGVLRGGGSVLSAGLGRCRSRATLTESQRSDIGVRCCLTPL